MGYFGISKEVAIRNFQKLPPAPKINLHPKQPAPWINRQPEQLHHVAVPTTFKVNFYMFRTSPLSYNLTSLNMYFFDFFVLNLSAVQLPGEASFKLAASIGKLDGALIALCQQKCQKYFVFNVWRKSVFDIYFTEFGAALKTVLPVLFKYCYKYCYSDSRKPWAVMEAGGLAL